MARFELNIYGADDEILKTFATDKVRWGVFLQALELQGELEQLPENEQFKAVTEFVKNLFPNMTNADIANADYEDVLNTFVQLINMADGVGGKSKNADRAAEK